MHRTARSIRLACRLLARRPGLAAGRLLTLTLVVAAVAAVMAIANVTLLRPLPFPRAGRLLHVYLQPPNTTTFSDANPLNPLEFERLREQARTFERVEGVLASERALTGGGEPEAVLAGRVSAGFFAVLSNFSDVLNFSYFPSRAATAVRERSDCCSAVVSGWNRIATSSACSRTPTLSHQVITTDAGWLSE